MNRRCNAPRDGAPDARQEVSRTRERDDVEGNHSIDTTSDVECLFAALGVSWEGSVRKPEPVILVGHIDDATGSYDIYESEVKRDNDDGAGHQRWVVRREGGPDVAMCLPEAECFLGASESPVAIADRDRVHVMEVAGRERGRVPRRADLGVGHRLVREPIHELLEVA